MANKVRSSEKKDYGKKADRKKEANKLRRQNDKEDICWADILRRHLVEAGAKPVR